MKRLLFLLTFGAPAFCPPVHAEPPAAVSAEASTAQDNFEKAKVAYLEKENALDEQIAPQVDAAKRKYEDALKVMVEKADKGVRQDDVEAIHEEAKRYQKVGVNSDPSDKLPGTLRKTWKAMQDEIAKLNQSFMPKRLAVRGAYLSSLDASKKAFATEKNAEGLAAVNLMRATVMLKTSIESNQIVSVGTEDKPANVKDIVEEGGYLIGFETGPGSWHKTPVLAHLVPIYATGKGERNGKQIYGEAQVDKRMVAKEGYAVGGLMVRYWGHEGIGYVIGSLQIIFMKINPDGTSLDPKDTYGTEWLGAGPDSEGKVTDVDCGGKMVVGIRCRHGEVVDSISLLHQR